MVPVHEVVMKTSAVVFLVCAFAWVNWWLTGFAAIYPSIAVLCCGFAILFWVMGYLMKKRDLSDAEEATAALADYEKNGGTSLEDLRKDLDI